MDTLSQLGPTSNVTLAASLPVVATDPKSEAAAPNSAVPRPSTVNVWGTDFAKLDMSQTVELARQVVEAGRPEYLVTANLNYLMLADEHPRLVEVNAHSLAVLADGFPIVARSRLGSRGLPCRVAGSDLIVELARLAANSGYRIYLLGAAPGVAQAAADELCSRFESLQIAGCYSPPFRKLTAAEHSGMLSEIRIARPDILLVAFGQPKGEFWIHDNLHELNVPLSIQLGASFDFLAGTARRAPRVWQRLGCEWLYRALSSPRRLMPRYARNIGFLLRTLGGDVVRCLGIPTSQGQGAGT